MRPATAAVRLRILGSTSVSPACGLGVAVAVAVAVAVGAGADGDNDDGDEEEVGAGRDAVLTPPPSAPLLPWRASAEVGETGTEEAVVARDGMDTMFASAPLPAAARPSMLLPMA